MARRYFEFSEGSSNKFWEVWCEGGSVYTRFGKIGSQGQTKVKELGAPAAAKKAHDALVGEKTRKGYVEKGKKTNGKAAAPPAPADDIVEIPEGWSRLELIDGTSRKFYQLKLDGKKLHIAYGRIGTAGTTETKKLKEEYEARREQTKLIAEKQKKGYVRVVPGPRLPPDVGAHDDALEAQVIKDRSDGSFEVYADWLQEQGDIRGELAALQARAAKQPKDKKLANQIEKLLVDNRARMYGPLAPYVATKQSPKQSKHLELAVEPTWRAGWFDRLALGSVAGWRSEEIGVPRVRDVAELVYLLPKCVSARLLHELVLTRAVAEDQFYFGNAVEALAKVLPSLPALRRLTVGEFDSSDCELSWSEMGKLDKLWPHLRHIEMLRLRSGQMELGKIDLPECRELYIETGGLTRKNLTAICNASWPKLETLSIWFGDDNYGGNCRVADVAPILDGKKFPRVKHLGLKNSQWGDELAPALLASKILPRLETLDVSMSHLTIAGIRTYSAAADRLRHLQSIDLSMCLLDAEALKLAKKLGKNVDVDRQGDIAFYLEEAPEMRYCRVGE